MIVSYSEQWATLRNLERIEFWALFSLIPLFLILATLPGEFGTNVPTFPIIAIWFVFVVAADYAALSFSCPRCDKPFFRTLFFRNGFAKKCVHCGLQKWADQGPPASEFNKEKDILDDPDDPVIGDQWKTP